jgi:hypothetical protein
MTRFLFAVPVLALAACSAQPTYTANENLLITGFPDLPKDAAKVAERLAGCQHFAGETGDNPPEREREIQAAMSDLRCESIEHDVSVIRAKYVRNQQVQAALTAASEL